MIALGRLDSILGKSGSKTKDSYESKLSLASRIVKVERTVSMPLLRLWPLPKGALTQPDELLTNRWTRSR